MYCAKCGEKNEDTAKFCRKCGNPLRREDEQNKRMPGSEKIKEVSDNTNPKKNKRKTWLLLAAVALLLLAVVIAGIIALKGHREKQQYNRLLTDAGKYMETLDYERAEDNYLQAIAIDPKKAEPYIQLADIYVAQEEFEKALDILKQAQKNVVEAESGEKTEEETQKDNREEIEDRLEELQGRTDYTWVVEPTIEADDIYYVAEGDDYSYSLNELNRQAMSPYAVIQKGESLGIIGMDGNLVGGMDYKEVSRLADFYVLTRKEPQYSSTYHTDWELYTISEDGEIQELEGIGSGDFYLTAFYYCDGLHHMVENDEWMAEDIIIPDNAFPLKNSETVYNEGLRYAKEWWNNLSGGYAIYHDSKLVTDFVYDSVGGCEDGLLAVCKRGKWGYVNENGEEVIPLEYNPSWKHYGTYENGEWKIHPSCYTASGGYVVLCRSGNWELRDISGKTAIPSGIFEEIRPVYENKCWVKKGGKWGVIELKGTGETKTEPEEVQKPDYRTVYAPIIQAADQQYTMDGIHNSGYVKYDIDKDGVDELLVREGTCEADFMYKVYTIKNGESIPLGELSGFHTGFYADEEGGKSPYIYRIEGHMGIEGQYIVRIENGAVTEEEISYRELEPDEEYYSNPYPLEINEPDNLLPLDE